jgi:5'-3' exonuclease
MKIHLVDGTYELFRSFFGAPPSTAPDGREVGATKGILQSLWALLRADGVTHVAAAFDQVIESFRNELYAGYKTGEGIDPLLWAQFPLAERASHALGIVTWPMVEFEADDALATAAARWADADGVEQVVICSPDKDLAQCVRGDRVVCFDRRQQKLLDHMGVVTKFGVPPSSIPDYLALVGDTSDGYPGVAKWGAKSAAALLARYERVEDIPADSGHWDVTVRGGPSLAGSLRASREDALLFKRLATLRTDAPLPETLDDLRWRGARREELTALCAEIGETDLPTRIRLWRE